MSAEPPSQACSLEAVCAKAACAGTDSGGNSGAPGSSGSGMGSAKSPLIKGSNTAQSQTCEPSLLSLRALTVFVAGLRTLVALDQTHLPTADVEVDHLLSHDGNEI